MLVGFRLYPLSFDFSATGQISARQVDAARRVAQLYAAFAKVKQLVADFCHYEDLGKFAEKEPEIYARAWT